MEAPEVVRSGEWIRIVRDGGRRKAFQYHGPFAAISGIILTIAWFVPYPDAVFNTCLLKRLVSIPCAFCGSTRSFAAMIHGDWGWAFSNSPMAAVLFLLTAFTFLVCLAAIAGGGHLVAGARLKDLLRKPFRWLGVGVVLILINWWYRLNCL